MTRHWENKTVTQSLEKLLAASQMSETSQKQMHPGKHQSFQSMRLLGIGNDVEALEQNWAGGGGQYC